MAAASRTRGRIAAGLGAALLAAAAASIGVSSPAGAQSQSDCATPSGNSSVFDYSSKVRSYGFRVPPNVSRIAATAEGGHGGEYDHTHVGGAGGGVDVTIPVTPGECLTVIVGGYGYHGGGSGWGKGGDHGTIPGGPSNPGSSAAGGGGASAILRSSTPLVVAGGGGGGGGDGQSGGSDAGGSGGAGGDPVQSGAGGTDSHNRGEGGKGGRGGGQKGHNGGGGASDSGGLNYHGAGGGGGGGVNGGSGGSLEHGQGFPATGGGGGGGGGTSAIFVPTPLNDPAVFFTSTRACVYKHFSDTCHGEVSLTWTSDTDPINPLALPLHPIVRVLPTDLIPVSIPINLSPVAPRTSDSPTSAAPTTVPVRLKLKHRHRGRYRLIENVTVTATSVGPSELELPVSRRVRRLLRKADVSHFRLIVIDEATGQRLNRHHLRIG